MFYEVLGAIPGLWVSNFYLDNIYLHKCWTLDSRGAQPKGLKKNYILTYDYWFFDLDHTVVKFSCDISIKFELDMSANQKSRVFLWLTSDYEM